MLKYEKVVRHTVGQTDRRENKSYMHVSRRTENIWWCWYRGGGDGGRRIGVVVVVMVVGVVVVVSAWW